jgi:DNA-binding GntR family transcriptional regulator
MVAGTARAESTHRTPGAEGQASAYDRFQHSLLSGAIRPGQLISQRELVGLLGVSLGSLRELLPRLATEGLLQVIPQRGIQITSVDMRMIRNAYQMRMALEREAVIAAVDSMPQETVVAQIALHRDILDRAGADMSDAVLREAQDIDAGMHRTLIEATRNDQLIHAYGIIAIRVRLINIERMRLTPGVMPQALGDHLRILDAIGNRDRGAAVAAIEAHILDARNRAVAF